MTLPLNTFSLDGYGSSVQRTRQNSCGTRVGREIPFVSRRRYPVSSDIQRSSLPISDRVQPGLTTYDAKDPDTKFPPIREVRPPAGAPNVLVVLLDDVGFGASSVFGGPCETPVAERLAGAGLRYNRFHTTALCAPSRARLRTGRNHHSVGMGNITELATSAPGYTSVRPNNKA